MIALLFIMSDVAVHSSHRTLSVYTTGVDHAAVVRMCDEAVKLVNQDWFDGKAVWPRVTVYATVSREQSKAILIENRRSIIFVSAKRGDIRHEIAHAVIHARGIESKTIHEGIAATYDEGDRGKRIAKAMWTPGSAFVDSFDAAGEYRAAIEYVRWLRNNRRSYSARAREEFERWFEDFKREKRAGS